MIRIVLLLLGNVVFNTGANLLMKIGMRKTSDMNLASINGIVNGLLLNPALIIGVFSYVASLGFYIFLIKNVNLSIAYPISVSCAIILVTFVSASILKESLPLNQIAGLIIIIIGIFVLTR